MLFESASVKDGAIKAFLSLFPAHAGVIPATWSSHSAMVSFPRARGGDPGTNAGGAAGPRFSPRTRG